MDKVTGRLTVFFEAPFWVGVFECISDEKLSVCKVTFGAEPKDYEVHEFILKKYGRLQFSPVVDADGKENTYNPKRMRREVRRQMQNIGVGTRSQQALKLQQEQSKIEHRTVRCKRRETQKRRQFELKQQKKKEKHKGR